jgi:hypothetical protein
LTFSAKAVSCRTRGGGGATPVVREGIGGGAYDAVCVVTVAPIGDSDDGAGFPGDGHLRWCTGRWRRLSGDTTIVHRRGGGGGYDAAAKVIATTVTRQHRQCGLSGRSPLALVHVRWSTRGGGTTVVCVGVGSGRYDVASAVIALTVADSDEGADF